MNYRDVKHRLRKRIVDRARRHTRFRAICIAWLAVYYSCRLCVRAVREQPRAAVAFCMALCLAFAAPAGVYAEIAPITLLGESDAEGEAQYRLEVSYTQLSGEVGEPPMFEIRLGNAGTAPLTGLEFLVQYEDCGIADFYMETVDEVTGEHVYARVTPGTYTLSEAEGEGQPDETGEADNTEELTAENTEASDDENAEVSNGENTEVSNDENTEPAGDENTEPSGGGETEPAGGENTEPSGEGNTGSSDDENTESSGSEDATEEQPIAEVAQSLAFKGVQMPLSEEMASIPTELAEGKSLSLFAVFSASLEPGDYSVFCRVAAKELSTDAGNDFELKATVEPAKPVTENPTDAENVVTPGAIEQPKEPTDVTTPGAIEEPKDSEVATPGAIEDSEVATPGAIEDSEVATPGAIEDSEVATPGAIEQPAEEEPDASEEEADSEEEASALVCEVLGIDCTKGYNMGGVFFAMGASRYVVTLSPASTVTELYYRVGSLTGTVPVSDYTAEVEIPENISDVMQIYYIDPSGQEVILHEAYIINEKTAPVISYTQVQRDGQAYAQVRVEESGDMISGIGELYASVDGAVVTNYTAEVLERGILPGGCEVSTVVQYEFPLEGRQEHSFEIVVQDNNGNVSVEYFLMHADNDDIIRVVLPTTFTISILPDEPENQLCGEDIILCNKSNFPLQVDISETEVVVDHSIPEGATLSETLSLADVSAADIRQTAQERKDCNLSLNVMTAETGMQTYDLQEGITEDIVSFILSPGSEDTDVEALQTAGIERVDSLDYSVMNLRGTVDSSTRNCWKSGDIRVRIKFRFNKYEIGAQTSDEENSDTDTTSGSQAVDSSGSAASSSGTQIGIENEAEIKREE